MCSINFSAHIVSRLPGRHGTFPARHDQDLRPRPADAASSPSSAKASPRDQVPTGVEVKLLNVEGVYRWRDKLALGLRRDHRTCRARSRPLIHHDSTKARKPVSGTRIKRPQAVLFAALSPGA